uniref:Sporulation related domain-containing protein n=1 Tax=Candidatus Kentrum sp. DK TaxID=2126562 RepID=A0A450T0B5_9GAMM|nr:MAG: Sporulation related domain-containing protein [Candidatus Kentron sp. DK]
MAHDYKHAAKTASSANTSPPSGWLWFLAGLSIGLFIAVLAYLSAQYSAKDAGKRIGQPPRPEIVCPENTREPPKAAKPDKPANTAGSDKTEFEFYTILPEREIRVSEYELRAQERTSEKAKTPVSGSMVGNYVLQVGSFRHIEDADQLKAALVLNGFDVEIQTVSTGNNDTWYRVRLGPYRNLDAVHEVRAELQKSGFSPLVLKEKN